MSPTQVSILRWVSVAVHLFQVMSLIEPLVVVAFIALFLQQRDARRAASIRSSDRSSVLSSDDPSEPRKSDDVYKGDITSTEPELVQIR